MAFCYESIEQHCELLEAHGGKAWDECEHSSNHKHYLTVADFGMEHLPPELRSKQHMEFIKNWIDRTVMITISYTSEHRPDTYPSSTVPYALADYRGKKYRRCGTGFLQCDLYLGNFNEDEPCPCHNCQRSDHPETGFWDYRVSTATHVVFDELEAVTAKVSLFFDRDDKKGIEYLYGVEVDNDWERRYQSDRCFMVCVTHEKKLAEKLNEICGYMEEPGSIGHFGFHGMLVSHPHGASKKISIGKLHDTFVFKNNEHKSILLKRGTRVFIPLSNQGFELKQLCKDVHINDKSGSGNELSSACTSQPNQEDNPKTIKRNKTKCEEDPVIEDIEQQKVEDDTENGVVEQPKVEDDAETGVVKQPKVEYDTETGVVEQPKVEDDTETGVVKQPKVEDDTETGVVEQPKVEDDTETGVVKQPKVEDDTETGVVEQPKVEDDTETGVVEQPKVEDDAETGVVEQPKVEDDTETGVVEQPKVEDDTETGVVEQPKVEDDTETGVVEQPKVEDDTETGVGEQPKVEDDTETGVVEQPKVEDDIKAGVGEQPKVEDDTKTKDVEKPKGQDHTETKNVENLETKDVDKENKEITNCTTPPQRNDQLELIDAEKPSTSISESNKDKNQKTNKCEEKPMEIVSFHELVIPTEDKEVFKLNFRLKAFQSLKSLTCHSFENPSWFSLPKFTRLDTEDGRRTFLERETRFFMQDLKYVYDMLRHPSFITYDMTSCGGSSGARVLLRMNRPFYDVWCHFGFNGVKNQTGVNHFSTHDDESDDDYDDTDDDDGYDDNIFFG